MEFTGVVESDNNIFDELLNDLAEDKDIFDLFDSEEFANQVIAQNNEDELNSFNPQHDLSNSYKNNNDINNNDIDNGYAGDLGKLGIDIEDHSRFLPSIKSLHIESYDENNNIELYQNDENFTSLSPNESNKSNASHNNVHKRKTNDNRDTINHQKVDVDYIIKTQKTHLKMTNSEKSTILNLPSNIFKSFNAGDFDRVREIIKESSNKTCALKTPAIEKEIIGQENVVNLLEIIAETHPDAVWVSKQARIEDNCLFCQINFAGTRLAHLTTTYSIKSCSTSVCNKYHLLWKNDSTLLDEMELSDLTAEDIIRIQHLEESQKNLSVLGNGSLKLVLDDNNKVDKFEFDWKIISFKEAGL
eukprot:gene14200-19054_t